MTDVACDHRVLNLLCHNLIGNCFTLPSNIVIRLKIFIDHVKNAEDFQSRLDLHNPGGVIQGQNVQGRNIPQESFHIHALAHIESERPFTKKINNAMMNETYNTEDMAFAFRQNKECPGAKLMIT